MSLVAVSMVRNKDHIIEVAVRHDLQHCEEALVVAHRCTDPTAAILRSLRDEGLRIVVEHDDSYEHRAAENVEVLMRLVQDFDLNQAGVAI